MSPGQHTVRSRSIVRIALRLAGTGELSTHALASRAELSRWQARRWIRDLLAQGLIRLGGLDPHQSHGRPRQTYTRR